MEPLLPEADESAQGEAWGLGGVPGGLPLTPLSPSLVLSWVLACSGQGASQALPVIFQGKDPKTEEFVPPGRCRNVHRGLWAVSRVWMGGASLGGVGDLRVEGRVEESTPSPPQMKTVP